MVEQEHQTVMAHYEASIQNLEFQLSQREKQ